MSIIRHPVARFLLRRGLLSIPTLVGITLVTFALLKLAPGDPVATGEDGLSVKRSRADRESMQRQYFLDLPVLYNPSPQGVSARVDRLLSLGLTHREAALRELLVCGTACLPSLASRLSGAQRHLATQALSRLRARHPELAAQRAASDPGALPLSTWVTHAANELERSRLERLATDVGATGEGVTALARAGTAALCVGLPRLLEARSLAAASLYVEVTERVTGVAGPKGSLAAVHDFWDEWWFVHRRELVEPTSAQRFFGHLTETQYGKWLARLLTLRLGRSFRDGRHVTEKIAEALPITALLGFVSLLLSYVIAVPLGVYCAVHAGKLFDRLVSGLLFVLYALPPFWVAMMLILVFGGVGYLDWLPIDGLCTVGLEQASGSTWLLDRVRHLVLPVICLTYGSLAVISRYQRSAMLEVLRQDYIRTARAKGLLERTVVCKHGLRNALLPTITLLGLQVPYLIGGSVIVERIFNLPGMGQLTFQALLDRDYPMVMATTGFSAVLTLAGVMLADLGYALADPRITLELE